MTGPEIGASATVDLVVREPDCANALSLSDDPHDNFPAVFATTRMIANQLDIDGPLATLPLR